MCEISNFIARHGKDIIAQDMCVRFIGNRERIDPDLLRKISWLEDKTQHAHALRLNIAINYGSRTEIVYAVRACAKAVAQGTLQASSITYETFSQHLYTHPDPDPDLLIRTSGEMRISNFLLCQIAYSELYFIQKFWPDITPQDLDLAIEAFHKRQRRFGKRL